MNIDLLYFDGCPSWKNALENLQTALAAEGIQATIQLVRIDGPDEAERRRFLGSPSFQVDGVDLWPEARARYDLACRVYATDQGLRGTPTVAMFRQRLSAVARQTIY